MHLVNRFDGARAREIDEAHRLVQAIARELWKRYGQDGSLNWDGVERHLARIVQRARDDSRFLFPFEISMIAPARASDASGGTSEARAADTDIKEIEIDSCSAKPDGTRQHGRRPASFTHSVCSPTSRNPGAG